MKRFLLLCVLVCLTIGVFADGTFTSIEDVAVTVSSMQSGDVCVRTNNNSIMITPTERDNLVAVLKAHSEALNTMQTEKIAIKKVEHTGYVSAQYKDSFGFWFYVNAETNPYVLRIRFSDRYRESLSFTAEQVGKFVSVLESTSSITNEYILQKKRVSELITQAKSSIK